jgi:hypothetical protein
MALFAAQAGVLPGLDLGSETTSRNRGPHREHERGAHRTGRAGAGRPCRRSASAGPDETAGRVRSRRYDRSARNLRLRRRARDRRPACHRDLPGDAADIRPAAFNPSTALPLPGAPRCGPSSHRRTQPASACPAAWTSAPDATDGAMIALGVAAPCHPDAAVTITHSGIAICLETDSCRPDDAGPSRARIAGDVTVTLPDGRGA